MEKKRVTTAALRKMEMGQSITFDLPDALAIDCGKTIAYRLQHALKCRFSAVSDFANNRLTITKTPRL